MRRETVDAWEAVAHAMAERHPSSRIGAVKGLLSEFFDRERAGLLATEEWPMRERRRLTARHVRRGTCAHRERGAADRDAVDAAKCVLDAHALVLAQPRDVERSLLDDAVAVLVPDVVRGGGGHLVRELTGRVPHRAPPAWTGPPDVVTFAHAWRRRADPRDALRIGTAEVALVTVDPDEAPVVVELRTGHRTLAVRRQGPFWMRPVMLPGDWEPATVAAFADAASGRVAWNDSPFTLNARGATATFALVDLAEAGVDASGAEGAREASAAAHRDAAGTLFVVDGVVHRATREPALSPAIHGGTMARGPFRATWTLGDDLDSTQSMATWRARPERAGWWLLERSPGRPVAGRGLPFEAADLAARVLDRVNREQAAKVAHGGAWTATRLDEAMREAMRIAEVTVPVDPDLAAARLLDATVRELGVVAGQLTASASAERREWLSEVSESAVRASQALRTGDAARARRVLARCLTMPAAGWLSLPFAYADALTREVVPELLRTLDDRPDLSELVL